MPVPVEDGAAQGGDGIGAQPVLLGGVGVLRAVDALHDREPADDQHQQGDQDDQAPPVAQPPLVQREARRRCAGCPAGGGR